MNALRLDRASAGYGGAPVLREVSLEIRAGERVALVGRSGAGKTTLLKLLHEARREDAALVPQEFGLVNSLSVFHNVFMGRLDHHRTWYNLANLVHPLAGAVERVRPVVARLGLDEKLFTPVGELSGGQRQRTAVGRALFRDGAILIGDEPVSAVDIPQAHNVLEAINAHYDTVVLAMHDVELALAYTERVIALRDGRIVHDSPSRDTSVRELAELC